MFYYMYIPINFSVFQFMIFAFFSIFPYVNNAVLFFLCSCFKSKVFSLAYIAREVE